MAIDTRDKRASAICHVVAGYTMPVPNSAIDAGDREQVAGLYRGIAAQTTVVTDLENFIATVTAGAESYCASCP